MQSLTLRQRRDFLFLTAASGCLVNLQIAAETAGLVLQATPRQPKASSSNGNGSGGNNSSSPSSRFTTALEAAADAGQLHICKWLRQQGCPWSGSLAAAAGAGHGAVCEWLLSNGCPWDHAAAYAAARGGHVGLMETLLLPYSDGCGGSVQQQRSGVRAAGLLAAVAEGCDMATLRRMYGELLGHHGSADATQQLLHESAQQQQQQQQRHPQLQTDRGKCQQPFPELQEQQCQYEMQQCLEQLRACHLTPKAAAPAAEEGEGALISLCSPQPVSPPLPLRPPPPPQQQQQQLALSDKVAILVAAASSPTPDWRAKVEWLEELGYPRSLVVAHKAIAATATANGGGGCASSNAVERATWLRARGYSLAAAAATVTAATAGDLALLEYLLATGLRPSWQAAEAAAARGNLTFLRALQAAGCSIPWQAIHGAADGGHLEVVAWVRSCSGHNCISDDALLRAARSGSVRLLEWLFLHGGRGWSYWERSIWAYAVEGGCEEVLRWLASRGYQMEQDNGQLFYMAAVNGDLSTLRCLRQLGCPWGPGGDPRVGGEVFAVCLADGDCPAAALRWLLHEASCPVDWTTALEAAGRRTGGDRVEVLEWLRGQQTVAS